MGHAALPPMQFIILTLFILIALRLLLRWVGPVLMRYVARRFMQQVGSQQGQKGNPFGPHAAPGNGHATQNPFAEPDNARAQAAYQQTTPDEPSQRRRRRRGDEGEYVDFEEIK